MGATDAVLTSAMAGSGEAILSIAAAAAAASAAAVA